MLKFDGTFKESSCQSRRNVRKVIRINTHLAENRVDNCAGLVWDPGNKKKIS